MALAPPALTHGCDLPPAWAGQAQWRILDTYFGVGLRFLSTWAAWRADQERPARLHFVALLPTQPAPIGEGLLAATASYPALLPLAQTLHSHCWGLLPGIHRIALDDGQVLLTLCIGESQNFLRTQDWTLDSVYLHGPDTQPALWNTHALKALARRCRRGTTLAVATPDTAIRQGLVQCGFTVDNQDAAPALLRATFNPHWQPRTARKVDSHSDVACTNPKRCMVIGAGIAGAAVASSLARRGWQVTVLDRAHSPAAGASGLPVGLCCPHVSPDDSVLSRLSRSGLRTTLQQVQALLRQGVDWQASGVLEHRVDGSAGLASSWHSGPGTDWSMAAPADILHAAQLPASSSACWHPRAIWLRPARLVNALLQTAGTTWQGLADVARLVRVDGVDGGPLWQALDAHGAVLASADIAVVAAGPNSRPLTLERLPLQAVRGQLSWDTHNNDASDLPWPPFPVNGSGSLISHIPLGDGSAAWYCGSTFERDMEHLPLSGAERHAAHASNWQRLEALLPSLATRLHSAWHEPTPPQDWASVRATAPDRLPIVGPVDSAMLPGLWACTAMGARGLTLGLLCGELLAARLHSEPLPIDSRLAHALSTERL